MRLAVPASILALGALLLQGCAVQAPPAAQPAPPEPRAECMEDLEVRADAIGKRHRQLLLALNAGQLDQAMAVYAPRAIAVTPGISAAAPFQGYAWIRQYLQEQLVAKGARFDTHLAEGINHHCDVSAHGGLYQLTLQGEVQQRPYLIVWRRMNADWFVIAHHIDFESRAPQPARVSSAP